MKAIDKSQFLNKVVANLKNGNYKTISGRLKDPVVDNTFSIEGVMLETLRKDFGIGNWKGHSFKFDDQHSIAGYLTYKDLTSINPSFTHDDYRFMERIKNSLKVGSTFQKAGTKFTEHFKL